jgi:hypothetical protein
MTWRTKYRKWYVLPECQSPRVYRLHCRSMNANQQLRNNVDRWEKHPSTLVLSKYELNTNIVAILTHPPYHMPHHIIAALIDIDSLCRRHGETAQY